MIHLCLHSSLQTKFQKSQVCYIEIKPQTRRLLPHSPLGPWERLSCRMTHCRAGDHIREKAWCGGLVWRASVDTLPGISCILGDRNCVEVGDAAKLGKDVRVTLLMQKEFYIGCCWGSPWARTNSESRPDLGRMHRAGLRED